MRLVKIAKKGRPELSESPAKELRDIEKPLPKAEGLLVKVKVAALTRGDVVLQKLPVNCYL